MSRFLQLHLLTFFPPANLNRDDTGRPKTAVVGGATRLRLSSQALKRAWRTSEAFERELGAEISQRSKLVARQIFKHIEGKCTPVRALEIANTLAGAVGKLDKEKEKKGEPNALTTLVFLSSSERDALLAQAARMAGGAKVQVSPATIFQRTTTAADVAMFGRMLTDEGLDSAAKTKAAKSKKEGDDGDMDAERAKRAQFSMQAAVQVAHAITTHRVTIDDDYFTAVDDLRRDDDDEASGAAHVGEAAFGSGVFYLYLCVDTALLTKNLGGDAALAATALGALAEAAAIAAPRGKQNSFAAHGRAHYILAERGDRQPRTLAGAFATPVEADLMAGSIKALKNFRAAIDTAYEQAPDASAEMEVGGTGRLSEIIAFCRG